MTTRKPKYVGVRQMHRRACPGGERCGCPWGWNLTVARGDGTHAQFTKQGYATAKDAADAREDVKAQHRAKTLTLSDRRITMTDWLNGWYAARMGSEHPWRATTARSYRQVIDNHLVPRLGRFRVADLAPEHLERAFRDLRRERPDLSASSRAGVWAVLRAALNGAVEAQVIALNPCGRVPRHARPRPQREEVRPWEPSELAAFLDSEAVREHRLGALFEVAAYTGLRRGELAGLRWVDVDLDAGILTVAQQVVQVGHDTQIGQPKTRSGQRRLDLDAHTVAVLRGVRRRQAEERLAWGPEWVDSGLVFTDEQGKGLHPERLSKTFGRLTEAAGLRSIRFHDLRHGAASLALAAGVDLAIVSKRLGHSTLTLTADTYSHLVGTVGREAAERAAALVPRQPREGRA